MARLAIMNMPVKTHENTVADNSPHLTLPVFSFLAEIIVSMMDTARHAIKPNTSMAITINFHLLFVRYFKC